MNKPCLAAINEYSPAKPVLIFVASRRQTRLTAFDLISYAASSDNPRQFLKCSDVYIEAISQAIRDEALRHTITFGIGLHHAGLSSRDRETVEKLYLNGEIQGKCTRASTQFLLRSRLIDERFIFLLDYHTKSSSPLPRSHGELTCRRIW